MATITIHEEDVEALVNGLGAIQEMHAIDLHEEPELRYALANLVGALREQQAATSIGAPDSIRNRIDLELLMTQKFRDWEKRRLEENDGGQSADDVLEFHLTNSDRSSDLFVSGLGASSSVTSFRHALDDCRAWGQYEVQMCASTKSEIADLTLGDMAHGIVLAGG